MVGPWGWAARMKREDLLVATAILMGYDFDDRSWPMAYYDDFGRTAFRRTKWYAAEMWLAHHGIEFDGTE